MSNQTVGLPVQFVAEKWLKYYWPLVESTTFIPQMNGEAPNSGKQITFRKRLSQLVAIYRASGGYIAFRIERNKGQLPGDIRRLLGGVMMLIVFVYGLQQFLLPDWLQDGDGNNVTIFGLGAVGVVGLGAIVLGAILMIWWNIVSKDFFTGKTLERRAHTAD
ncbi:hypothetical protein EBZ80_27645 [bacterium]|nr:hypothetical protein [bacterium]